MANEVVRVAVLNNFNCTPKEFKQVYTFSKEHPDKYFFINSNVNTPKLADINKHPYKAVITLNPNLTDLTNAFKVGQVNKDKIAFVRIKWVPGIKSIENLITMVSKHIAPVVVTMQRFNSKKTVEPFGIDNYAFSCSRYRLTKVNKEYLEKFVDTVPNTYICDRKGLGCKACGLCSTLTCGQDLPISSLNLSTSGTCPYQCCDCYAKAMQKFIVGCGLKPIAFDVIKKNEKQRGTTKHIKDNKKK